MFLVLYVDDMIVFAKNLTDIANFKEDIFKVFNMTEDDCSNYFLGTHIKTYSQGVIIY